MMKLTTLLSTVGLVTLIGCTNQTRDEYSQAGKTAEKALSTDLKHGENAAAAATKAANASLKKDQAKANREAKQLSNATISPKIKAALDEAPNLHASNILVKTVGRKITISGSVPTAAEKSRTQQIAAGIAGSTYKIKNELQVG